MVGLLRVLRPGIPHQEAKERSRKAERVEDLAPAPWLVAIDVAFRILLSEAHV